MIDVFFGESRTFIKDTLMQRLGWKRGDLVWWTNLGGEYVVRKSCGDWALQIYERSGKYCFGLKIPGVSRGRLNGARGVEGKVENGVLVIDVRELLAPRNP